MKKIDFVFIIILLIFISHSFSETLGSWDFDNNLYDNSGNSNNFSVQQGTITYIDSFASSVLNFDGSTYLGVTSSVLNASFTTFSIGAWVFIDDSIADTAVDAGIIAQSKLAYGITYHNNGRIYGYVDSGATYIPASISTGEWHHVVETFDGDTMKLYIDNIEVASKLAISSYGDETHATGLGDELRIGKSYDSGTLFKGMIDEAFFTTDVLTLGEIQSIGSIPEPSVYILFLLGLISVLILIKKA